MFNSIWIMIATACGMLGLIQCFLWWHSRREAVYPLATMMAFSAVAVTILEMSLSSSPDVSKHQGLLEWLNLAIAMVLVPMIWSVQTYLPTGRRWMAILITALWAIGMAINFLFPGNLTFSEVLAVERNLTFWGEEYFVSRGRVNDWKWLVDITVLLIPLYVLDAAWRARRTRRAKEAWVIAGGIVLFVIIAGSQAILADAGLYSSPYVVSLAFLIVVVAMTWTLARDAVRTKVMDGKVAEARRETERLMRANLMGEVAAALAHEINQPLAAILGNAQAAEKFLDRPDPDLGEIRAIMADIVRDDKRARDIIANLRRMLRGDNVPDQRVNLESAVLEVVDFLEDEFKQHDISVCVDLMSRVPEVCGGRVAIEQIIMNLLLNAGRAVREAGALRREIHVELGGERGGAEIVVRDYGPGIDAEIQTRLFEPFVTTTDGSLGMGLVVCRRIVESQGGRITAENAEDGGARFRIWLPSCRL